MELLVGVSEIKNPGTSYKSSIFTNAGALGLESNFKYELGYSLTEDKYRGNGISCYLNQGLVNEILKENIYATIANESMRKTLKRIGFVELRNPYKGQYNTDYLQLFGLVKKINSQKIL